MSLRLLALDLYKAQQKVHRLQAEVDDCQLSEVDAKRQELKVAENELSIIRKMLEGRKADPFEKRTY